MPTWDRSGRYLDGIKIGRWKCLRQDPMVAGESWQPMISGEVRFAALREQMSTPLQATMLAVWTPYRYLWDGWPAYVKQGFDATGSRPPTRTGKVPACLGIGETGDTDQVTHLKWYYDNYLRVYNWHLKWPTHNDKTAINTNNASDEARFGLPGVALAHTLTRGLTDELSTADYAMTLPSNRSLDIRDLQVLKARYSSELELMLTGQERYKEVLSNVWKVSGVHDAEKNPNRHT